jgi:hypothetical protein
MEATPTKTKPPKEAAKVVALLRAAEIIYHSESSALQRSAQKIRASPKLARPAGARQKNHRNERADYKCVRSLIGNKLRVEQLAVNRPVSLSWLKLITDPLVRSERKGEKPSDQVLGLVRVSRSWGICQAFEVIERLGQLKALKVTSISLQLTSEG